MSYRLYFIGISCIISFNIIKPSLQRSPTEQRQAYQDFGAGFGEHCSLSKSEYGQEWMYESSARNDINLKKSDFDNRVVADSEDDSIETIELSIREDKRSLSGNNDRLDSRGSSKGDDFTAVIPATAWQSSDDSSEDGSVHSVATSKKELSCCDRFFALFCKEKS